MRRCFSVSAPRAANVPSNSFTSAWSTSSPSPSRASSSRSSTAACRHSAKGDRMTRLAGQAGSPGTTYERTPTGSPQSRGGENASLPRCSETMKGRCAVHPCCGSGSISGGAARSHTCAGSSRPAVSRTSKRRVQALALPLEPCICRPNPAPSPAPVASLLASDALYQALVLGLCTSWCYDPQRPVLWTRASLTRQLELFDGRGFYA